MTIWNAIFGELKRLIVAMCGICIGAFGGAIVGGMSGAAFGTMIFPIFGTVTGFLWGVPGGFVAGVVGASLSGKTGWTIGGILGGIAIGILSWPWAPTGQRPGIISLLILGVLPCVIGGGVGFTVGDFLKRFRIRLPAALDSAIRGTSVAAVLRRCIFGISMLAIGILRLWPYWRDLAMLG